jgi:hypothetical protein
MRCKDRNTIRRLQALLAVVVFFAISAKAHGQVVCIDNRGNPCSAAEIKKKCTEEKVQPNLTLAKATKVSGVLLDGTGTPVDFDRTMFGMKTVLQVRDLKTNEVLYTAPLLEMGRFEFGTIPAGQFRLLAVWTKGSEVSRLPLADEPKAMSCSDAPECQVTAVIHFHGTDDFYDSCPPK